MKLLKRIKNYIMDWIVVALMVGLWAACYIALKCGIIKDDFTVDWTGDDENAR
jgi:hypothetical protein